MTTPKPVSPVEAWGIVGPDGVLLVPTISDVSYSIAWDKLAFMVRGNRDTHKRRGYRAVKLRVEVVE